MRRVATIVPGGPPAAGTNSAGFLVSSGMPSSVVGNELPNAPEWTVSLAAQYSFQINESWDMTLRGDWYYQSSSFSRIFNTNADRLDSWNNLNFTTQCFVGIDEEQLARKIRALTCYESQKHRSYASEEFVRSLAITRGTQSGVRYAEAFEVIRWIL